MRDGNSSGGSRYPIVPESTPEAEAANVHLTREALVHTAGLSAEPDALLLEAMEVPPVSTADGRELLHSIHPEADKVMEVTPEQLAAMRRESIKRTLEWVNEQMEAARGKSVGKRPSVRPVRAISTEGPRELFCVIGDGKLYRVTEEGEE